jgi:hypothetical protein
LALTGTVAATVLVAASITDTELDSPFATYTLRPSGVTAAPCGCCPTWIVVVTVLVAVSITETRPGEALFP